MRKWFICILTFLLLAIPVNADTPLVVDDSGLLQDGQVGFVEESFREIERTEGFAPIVVTIDSFGGLSAEEYAGNFYDAYGYGENGILLLVSLEEGEWYILTNGLCADRISDYEASRIGEKILPDIREGLYYEAFLEFAQLSVDGMQPDPVQTQPERDVEYEEDDSSANGVIVVICMAIGLGIGILVMGYLSAQMKTVRMQDNAADYIRPGSMQITNSRDIFLYSHVTRTAKPKSNSSGGGRSSGGSRGSGGSRSSGGSRGGAGGRI